MLWTEEAINLLKRLAIEGRSARAIALALGAASRSAVIGKANRIGVKLNGDGRASAPIASPAGAQPSRSAAVPGPEAAGEESSAPARFGASRIGRRRERKTARTFAEAEVGEMRRLRLEDIGQPACRWPLGEPGSGDFAYCGLAPAEGRPYCAGHCRLAYRPPATTQSGREPRGSRPVANSWRLS